MKWEDILKVSYTKDWSTTTQEEYDNLSINDKRNHHKGMIRHYLSKIKAGNRRTMEARNHRKASEFFEDLIRTGKEEPELTYDKNGVRVSNKFIPQIMDMNRYLSLSQEDKIDYHRKATGSKAKRPRIQPHMSKEAKFHTEMLLRLNKPGGLLNQEFTYPSLEELEKKKTYTRENQWEDLGLILRYE